MVEAEAAESDYAAGIRLSEHFSLQLEKPHIKTVVSYHSEFLDLLLFCVTSSSFNIPPCRAHELSTSC